MTDRVVYVDLNGTSWSCSPEQWKQLVALMALPDADTDGFNLHTLGFRALKQRRSVWLPKHDLNYFELSDWQREHARLSRGDPSSYFGEE